MRGFKIKEIAVALVILVMFLSSAIQFFVIVNCEKADERSLPEDLNQIEVSIGFVYSDGTSGETFYSLLVPLDTIYICVFFCFLFYALRELLRSYKFVNSRSFNLSI